MSVDEDLARRVVDYLNNLIAIDREAVEQLCAMRVACNSELAAHPSVQVGATEDQPPRYWVRLLGILNGLCGSYDDGWGAVAAIVEPDGSIWRFEVLTPEIRAQRKAERRSEG